MDRREAFERLKIENFQRERVSIETVDDIPVRQDQVLLSILQIDPDTGYPAPSLEYAYERVNDPEIREYIRQRMIPVPGAGSRTDDPDEALELVPGSLENRLAYAQRVRDYISKLSQPQDE